MRLENLTKTELIELLKSQISKKRYGLTWERDSIREDVVASGSKVIPTFFLDKSREVATSGNSGNCYLIEGDNFHALSALQYTHNSSIDVIYIDPPYNTGNKDFKYNDSWVKSDDVYRHSKWLNFMEKRLKLAKALLKDDGVIFISIDDNEFAQLKLLCDGIFGESKFIACFVWEKKRKASNLDSNVRGITEYVLAYGAKNPRPIIHPSDLVEEEKPYPFYNSGNSRATIEFPPGISFSSIEDGKYEPKQYKAKKTLVELLDAVVIKNGKSINKFRLSGEWRYSQKWLDRALQNGEEIVFKGKDFKPYWINRDPNRSKRMKTLLNYENYQIGTNEDGNEELFKLIGPNDFSFPKPISLIKALIAATTDAETPSTILDFFAGSGTTGEAVLQLNQEDSGSRDVILVTNNEGNICSDVTFPRLKAAIEGRVLESGEVFQGYGGQLHNFQVKFVKRSLNSDEIKIRIMDSCIDLLCFREGVFHKVSKDNSNFSIFSNADRAVGIYNSFDISEIETFRQILSHLPGKKKAYIFSFDNFGLNPNEFIDWNDIEVEPIPQKIIEVIGNAYAD